jgi:hypothetical protein
LVCVTFLAASASHENELWSRCKAHALPAAVQDAHAAHTRHKRLLLVSPYTHTASPQPYCVYTAAFCNITGKDIICTTCVCALVSAFAPALAAGGVTFDAAAPEAFPLAQAAGIVRSCAEEYLVAMMMAGVDVSSLAELNNCGFASSTDVPSCLATEIHGVNTANGTAANVTASSRTGTS